MELAPLSPRALVQYFTPAILASALPHDLTIPESAIRKRATPRLSALLLGSLVVSLLALLFFSWLAREIFEGELTNFDLHARLTVHQWANPTLTLAMKAISDLGSPVFLSALFVVLIVAFLRVSWRNAAVWLAISMAGAVVLDLGLKHFFHRTRPVAYFIPEPSGFSFPSGHALGSFCFYMVLAGLLTARLRHLGARVLIWVFAALLVAAIGFSRVYLGVHWPTDVIAGYSAASFWVAGLLTLDRWRRH